MFAQGCKQPFQGFCLTELYRRIAVSVLYMDDNTAPACHTGERTERFLVGVCGIVFLRGNELMVKVHIQELTTLENPRRIGSFIKAGRSSSLVLNAYVFPLGRICMILSVASCDAAPNSVAA